MNPIQFYKCLSDETRLRCLMLIENEGELCVCELTEALAESQPKVSRHLAQLRQCELLLDRKQGQWVYYRLHPGLQSWQRNVLAATRDGLGAVAPCAADVLRLQAIERQKQAGDCC